MPRLLKPCLTPGCANLTEGTRCREHYLEWERARRRDPELTGRRDRPTPQKIRRRVLVRDRYRCQDCGARNLLEVHHINGERDDNRLENLIVLCRNCHLRADRALGIWR